MKGYQEYAMLNYIWAAMIGIGILFGAINGNMKEITEAALESAGEIGRAHV